MPQPSNKQANGRSPVWVRMCAVRVPDCLNVAPQPSNKHSYGLSPEWVRIGVGAHASNQLMRELEHLNAALKPAGVMPPTSVALHVSAASWPDDVNVLPQPSYKHAFTRYRYPWWLNAAPSQHPLPVLKFKQLNSVQLELTRTSIVSMQSMRLHMMSTATRFD